MDHCIMLAHPAGRPVAQGGPATVVERGLEPFCLTARIGKKGRQAVFLYLLRDVLG